MTAADSVLGDLVRRAHAAASDVDELERRRARCRVLAGLGATGESTTVLGDYRLQTLIGRGGFGTVWKAHDDRLDRTIAIKRVQLRHGTAYGALGEARTLASVHHPNIVEIFDVVAERDAVVFVLEYVDGPSLGAWLDATPPIAAVRRVFAEVGAALAAVHDAGLVHGDFKPSNVVVGAAARARLIDFGLCIAADAPWDVGPTPGTTGFMAPELRDGPPTARSDQFAFCRAYTDALASLPGSHSAEHARVRDALRRGTSEDPNDRWPSMNALLTALHARRRRRIRPWLLVGLACAGAGVAVATATPDPAPSCRALEVAWTPADAAAIRRSFSSTLGPRGISLADDVTQAIDAWVASHEEAHRAACAQRQSEVARACLAAQRRRTQTFIHALGDAPSRALASSSLRVAQSLPRPQECLANVEAAARVAPVTPSALDDEVSRAVFSATVYDVDHAQDEFERLLAAAQAQQRFDLQSEVGQQLGQLLLAQGRAHEAIAALSEAYFAASEHGYDAMANRASLRLAMAHAFSGDEAGAKHWSGVAQAAARGAPMSPRLATFAALTDGFIAMQAERPADATRHFRRAVGLAQDPNNRQPSLVVAATSNLARALAVSGEPDALETAARAVELHATFFGIDDWQRPMLLASLASAALQAGEVDSAREAAERGLRLAETRGPGAASMVAELHRSIADVCWQTSDHACVLRHAKAAHDGFVAVDPTRTLAIARPRLRMVQSLMALGRNAEAASHAAVADALTEDLGPDHPQTRFAVELIAEAKAAAKAQTDAGS